LASEVLEPQSDGNLIITGRFRDSNPRELINTGFTEKVWDDPSLPHGTNVRVEPRGDLNTVARLQDYPSFVDVVR
jgi:hypothetical protein